MIDMQHPIEAMVANERDLVRPLRRAEFMQLATAGCFDDPVELLYGVVVKITAPSPEHEESVWRVSKRLTLGLGDRARVRTNMSFAASDISLPRPDVLVTAERDLWHDHPDQALLAIEVTRTSWHRDHVVKTRLYAEADVLEYWIVDHDEDCVIVHLNRRDGVWTDVRRCPRGERVTMLAFPDVGVAVDDVLPPR